MLHNISRRLLAPFRQLAREERGQALLEFLIVYPLFFLLVLFVIAYGWWWWNQSTAACAIHDGTYEAARREGDIGAGEAAVRAKLEAALGGTASAYAGHYSLSDVPGMRSVRGNIHKDHVIDIPWVGDVLFAVKAQSFQRKERFYGGPPAGWW